MGIAQVKKQYYHKGLNKQKQVDITIDLKRREKKEMKEWTVEQKIMTRAFIERVSGTFEIFKKEILEAIK